MSPTSEGRLYVPGSVRGPAARNEDAEAEFVGGMEHFELHTYLHVSGSNYYQTCFFQERAKNYLSALWLCSFLTIIIVQTSSNGVSVSKERAVEAQ